MPGFAPQVAVADRFQRLLHLETLEGLLPSSIVGGEQRRGWLNVAVCPTDHSAGSIVRECGDGCFEIHRPDFDDFARCLAELTNLERVRELSAGARRRRDHFPWERTTRDVLALLE